MRRGREMGEDIRKGGEKREVVHDINIKEKEKVAIKRGMDIQERELMSEERHELRVELRARQRKDKNIVKIQKRGDRAREKKRRKGEKRKIMSIEMTSKN